MMAVERVAVVANDHTRLARVTKVYKRVSACVSVCVKPQLDIVA